MKVFEKRVCRYIIWMLFFIFMIMGKEEICQAEEPESSQIHALSAVLMDAKSGRVLYSKEGDVMRPMASTTKIMTCILALEEGNLEDEVSVSQMAASQPAVHLKMKEGQKFYLEDLLYSLMLESHNDTAVAIAEHIGGSVEAFAGKMNDKARQLGCENSYFITPNGLDDEDEKGIHSISAEDLATIMSYCISASPMAEKFLEITRTNSHTFTDVSGQYSYSCQNHNAFLDMMEGALSGKTGYTGGAGYCYVGALKREDRIFVVALLGSGWPNQKNYKWQDTMKLMQYGVETYHYEEVPIVSQFPEVTVLEGNKPSLDLFEKVTSQIKVDSDESSFQLLTSEKEEIHAKVEKSKTLKAPVLKGQKVGKITYYIDKEMVKEFPIVTIEAIEQIEYKDVFVKLIKQFLELKMVY